MKLFSGELAGPSVHAPTMYGTSVGRTLRLGVLPCALITALVLATLVGPVSISPSETVQILLFKLGLHPGQVTWSPQDEAIIWQLRLPRVVAAALVGGALAVAGSLFQAVLRNPLADPYVIGTAAGAQLGVSIALLLPFQFAVLGFGPLQILAFVAALGTVMFVYSIARTGGRAPVVTVLLAGFVVSSFLISATSFLLMSSNNMSKVLSWTMGSMDVNENIQLAITGPLVLAAASAAFLLARRLDVILLGEEQAVHLGVHVERLRLTAIVLASLLTALAVSLAGIVAFVGLIAPHTMRLIYGPGHRLLIPTAACGGAIFLLLADLLAHVVLAPTIIPLGVVTAIVGAPFFLHLLRQSRREYSF